MPDVPKRFIMHEVGKLWRQIKEDELKIYEKMARDDLDRFKQEHGEFVSKINILRHENIQPREEGGDLTKELRDLIE